MCNSNKTMNSMISAVSNYFDDEELIRQIQHFIHHKAEEGFSFARLTKLHLDMYGGRGHPYTHHVCGAVEMMILALDIMDDLQDQDAMNKPWCTISHAISMNIATGLLMLSMHMIHETSFDENRKQNAIHLLHQQVLKAVQGQHKDLQQELNSEDDYINMIQNKSGSLMACACVIGVTLVSSEDHDQVKDYATNFGIAAQLQNDLQDVMRGDQQNDLLYKKHTLPIFKLLEEDCSYASWVRQFYKGERDKPFMYEHKVELLEWIRQSSSIKYVQVLKRVYQRKTIQQIHECNTNEHLRQKLCQVIEQL